MARAGRKRVVDLERGRYPGGQLHHKQEAPSPTLVKRAALLSLMGLADPMYGTVPGIWFLSRKIDSAEYEAAKRFAELYGQYSAAMTGPKPPSGINMERGIGTSPIDVESDAGAREASKQVDIMSRYNAAHTALRTAGKGAEEELIRFCSGPGQHPMGWEGVLRVRSGLSALTVLWKIKRA